MQASDASCIPEIPEVPESLETHEYYWGWAFLGHAEILLSNGHTIRHFNFAWHLDELVHDVTAHSFEAVADYARNYVLIPHLHDLARDIGGNIDWESLNVKAYYLGPTWDLNGPSEDIDNWTPTPGDRSLPDGTRFR